MNPSNALWRAGPLPDGSAVPADRQRSDPRFELDLDTRQLLVDGKPAKLGARAFDILHALVEHRDRVVGKAELLERVWPGMFVEENNLQVHVSALRKVLGRNAVTTVPGRGYRFTAAAASVDARAGIQAIAPAPGEAASVAVLPFATPGLAAGH